MRKITLGAIMVAGLIIASVAIAGHHYHGHGFMMPSWNMNDIDADGDGALTFDEYVDTYKKSLRSGFDMIDQNNNGKIGTDEWEEFLKVHGMSSKS